MRFGGCVSQKSRKLCRAARFGVVCRLQSWGFWLQKKNDFSETLQLVSSCFYLGDIVFLQRCKVFFKLNIIKKSKKNIFPTLYIKG